MKSWKIILAGIAGAILFIVLGWLFYGVIWADAFQATNNSSIMREMDDMVTWAFVLSNLFNGFFVFLLLHWKKVSSLAEAMVTAFVAGFFIGSSVDLSYYSMTEMFYRFSGVLLDVILYSIIYALVGAVEFYILGLHKKN